MDLYGLPPEEFTAARDAAAKQDKGLKALRKPTVSAWVVNTLVRHDSALLDDLAALGASLLEAQQSGQGPELRALTEQRRQLVGSVTEQAIALVDRDLTAAARSEVEATLDAVLADPASAEAVRSGQLVQPLAFAGFGGVDLEGAVAPLPRVTARTRSAPPTPDAPTPAAAKATAAKATAAKGAAAKGAAAKGPGTATAPKAAAVRAAQARADRDARAAESAAHDAAGALDDAVRRAESAARAVEQQDELVEQGRAAEAAAAETVAAARAAVEAAEAQERQARKERLAAEKEREVLLRKGSRAAEAVTAAQDVAAAARRALDALRRG